MRFYVGITDDNWFKYLRAQRADEVNFWQPSGNTQFRALQPGELFLFKLHSPNNFIVGGGFFSHFTLAPISFAWDAFETKNGAGSLTEMRSRVEKYRHIPPSREEDHVIGCILLQRTFFWDESAWIPVPNWAHSIVRGKGYSDGDPETARLWSAVQERLSAHATEIELLEASDDRSKFGAGQLIFPRLGQSAFRMIVADNYRRQCAVTSSHILHILEAAHIRPYARGGTHAPYNGILLRSDLHTLFDKGYLTVTPEHRLEVSSRIKAEFNNGTEYYAMHGKRIFLPEHARSQPSPELLRWHNENLFKG